MKASSIVALTAKVDPRLPPSVSHERTWHLRCRSCNGYSSRPPLARCLEAGRRDAERYVRQSGQAQADRRVFSGREPDACSQLRLAARRASRTLHTGLDLQN
jgi:hypothetical protein